LGRTKESTSEGEVTLMACNGTIANGECSDPTFPFARRIHDNAMNTMHTILNVGFTDRSTHVIAQRRITAQSSFARCGIQRQKRVEFRVGQPSEIAVVCRRCVDRRISGDVECTLNAREDRAQFDRISHPSTRRTKTVRLLGDGDQLAHDGVDTLKQTLLGCRLRLR
jgi:hypothetical protein